MDIINLFAAQKMLKPAPNFSHIYLESGARDYPAAQDVLSRFGKAKVIEIKHYKEIFNRVRQDQIMQKNAQKLILARQTGNFLYPGTHVMQDFGHSNFFYNLLAINCVYDCSYCFLQGMHSSANIVLFVNNQDYFTATKEALTRLGQVYLCLSYQTDLLGIENLYPYCREWIEFARNRPGLLIEIRTKSANFAAISDLAPSENVILAWTLSPQQIAKKYELGAASLEKRLTAARKAQDKGWKVRICIDPILLVDNWEKQYELLVSSMFEVLDARRLYDASIGTLRLSQNHHKNIKKLAGNSSSLMSNLHISSSQACYRNEDHNSLTQAVLCHLERHLSRRQIHLS